MILVSSQNSGQLLINMVKIDSKIKTELLNNNCCKKDTTDINEISELISNIIFKSKCGCEILELKNDITKISEAVTTLQNSINDFLGEDKITLKYDNNKLIISCGDNSVTIDLSSNAQLATVDDINSLYKPFNANGYNYVDLKLPSGTLWATCNVGAENPEGIGNYYAWGQIYDYTTVKTSNVETEDIQGTKYDVAHVNWGGDWVIPNYTQILELKENCTITYIEDYFIIESKINHKQIILPNTGGYYDAKGTQHTSEHKYVGNLWVSTFSKNDTCCSLNYFDSSGIGYFTIMTSDKNYGIPVRPVITRTPKYDSTLNETSINAAQNKAIKAYIDSLSKQFNFSDIVCDSVGSCQYILYYNDENNSRKSTCITVKYDSDKNQAYIYNDEYNYKIYIPDLTALTDDDTFALNSDLKKKADLFNNDQNIRTNTLQAVSGIQTKEIDLEYTLPYPDQNKNPYELENNPRLVINYHPDNRALRVQKEESNYYAELEVESLTQNEVIAYKSDITKSINESGYDITIDSDNENLSIKSKSNSTDSND